jgi:hypothetical protein
MRHYFNLWLVTVKGQSLILYENLTYTKSFCKVCDPLVMALNSMPSRSASSGMHHSTRFPKMKNVLKVTEMRRFYKYGEILIFFVETWHPLTRCIVIRVTAWVADFISQSTLAESLVPSPTKKLPYGQTNKIKVRIAGTNIFLTRLCSILSREVLKCSTPTDCSSYVRCHTIIFGITSGFKFHLDFPLIIMRYLQM